MHTCIQRCWATDPRTGGGGGGKLGDQPENWRRRRHAGRPTREPAEEEEASRVTDPRTGGGGGVRPGMSLNSPWCPFTPWHGECDTSEGTCGRPTQELAGDQTQRLAGDRTQRPAGDQTQRLAGDQTQRLAGAPDPRSLLQKPGPQHSYGRGVDCVVALPAT